MPAATYMAWFDGIVLEGQAQVEAVGPQIPHDPLLERGDLGVVTPVAHDQEVPAQPVAVQPGQRLRLHPQRAAGEQDDRQRRVEELQEPGDLLDDRVVAARLEKGGPVPIPPLDEVLATGGVGQDPVDVEDDGRRPDDGPCRRVVQRQLG